MSGYFDFSHPPVDIQPLHFPAVLRPSIEAARDEADRRRRLPAELIDELRSSGVFRLYTPRELGGFEVGLGTAMTIFEQLGRIDGPTAWTIWNNNLGVFAGILPPQGVATIWGEAPDPIIANSAQPGRAVSVDGGFQLSGRWSIVSGVESADWLVLFGVVFEGERPRMSDDGIPDVRIFLVPRADVIVLDTWHVNGMRGTGSNAVVGDNLFVPAELVGDILSEAWLDRPLYRIPVQSIIIPGAAAILLGMARSAIDEVVRLAPRKKGRSGVSLAEQPYLQATIARADAQVAAARLLLLSTTAEMDQSAAVREPVTEQQRATLRGTVSHACQISREVLTSMYEIGGSASFYEGNPLERIFRDGMVACQHIELSATHFELAGRVRLGLPAGSPNF